MIYAKNHIFWIQQSLRFFKLIKIGKAIFQNCFLESKRSSSDNGRSLLHNNPYYITVLHSKVLIQGLVYKNAYPYLKLVIQNTFRTILTALCKCLCITAHWFLPSYCNLLLRFFFLFYVLLNTIFHTTFLRTLLFKLHMVFAAVCIFMYDWKAFSLQSIERREE